MPNNVRQLEWPWPFSIVRWEARNDALCMKNIANADRPKSVAAMLPPRPFRGSGKVAQTACNSDRREGKSCIPTLNQTFADSRILKISKFPTFRIAGDTGVGLDRASLFATRTRRRAGATGDQAPPLWSLGPVDSQITGRRLSKKKRQSPARNAGTPTCS